MFPSHLAIQSQQNYLSFESGLNECLGMPFSFFPFSIFPLLESQAYASVHVCRIVLGTWLAETQSRFCYSAKLWGKCPQMRNCWFSEVSACSSYHGTKSYSEHGNFERFAKIKKEWKLSKLWMGEKCFHSIREAVRFQLVMVNSKRSETHFLSGVVSSKLKPGRM